MNNFSHQNYKNEHAEMEFLNNIKKEKQNSKGKNGL